MSPDTKPTKKKVSTSETGHAKNAVNLGVLANGVESFGSAYVPALVALTAANIRALMAAILVVLGKIDAAMAAYTTAANRRQEAYEGMSKLATRVLAAVKVLCTDREYADAATIVRKIKGSGGHRLKAEDPSQGPKPKRISTSQLSFASRADNFKELTALLAGIPAYKPNEADLKVAAINAYLDSLGPISEAVNRPWAVVSNLRIERGKLLYAPGTGALAIAAKVKAYVKSIYGANSKQYKMVAGIEFRVVKS